MDIDRDREEILIIAIVAQSKAVLGRWLGNLARPLTRSAYKLLAPSVILYAVLTLAFAGLAVAGTASQVGYEDGTGAAHPGQRGVIAQLFYTVSNAINNNTALALVIAAGCLAVYGVTVFMTKHKATASGGQELLHILEIRRLAPGKAIYLVEVAGRVLVLGITGSSISLLSELVDIEGVDALKRLAAEKPNPTRLLRTSIGKLANRPPSERDKDSGGTAEGLPGAVVEGDTQWRDDIKSTGENISKILEEIRKQDQRR